MKIKQLVLLGALVATTHICLSQVPDSSAEKGANGVLIVQLLDHYVFPKALLKKVEEGN